jgi:hypothetical protein
VLFALLSLTNLPEVIAHEFFATCYGPAAVVRRIPVSLDKVFVSFARVYPYFPSYVRWLKPWHVLESSVNIGELQRTVHYASGFRHFSLAFDCYP